MSPRREGPGGAGRERLPAAFPPGVFAGRRERVLARLSRDAMLLPAAPVRRHSGDSEYRYRPDSDLYWLTGVEEPGAVALLRGYADEDRYLLFVRERDEKAERWEGPRLGPQGAVERLDADAAHPLEELDERLPDLLAGARRIHYRLGCDRRVGRLVEEALADARRRGQRTGRGPRGVVDPGEILDDLRLVKDDAEVSLLRTAAELTVEGHRALLAAAGPGVGEWELEGAFAGAIRKAGADGPAFATVVASGANACTLHYTANADTVEEGDLVLVDAGAEAGYYAGDVTRTFPASGSFTERQRILYDLVLEARERALAAGEPGTTLEDVHRAALDVLVEGLVGLGILDGDPPELIDEEAHKPFVPHNTGHWLGLDVHDVGDYAREGEPRPLVPGMVYTVEPGLYVPPDAGDAAAPFAGLGVRIEDDVLMTSDGPELLTGELPVEPDALTGLVGSGR